MCVKAFDFIVSKLVMCTICLFVLLFSNYSIVSGAPIDNKNILIINSYQEGLTWTHDEVAGILSVLKGVEQNTKYFVEYMDWKSYPNEENLLNFNNLIKYKYSKIKLDLIITTDDAALDFALNNRGKIFNNVPIVFCGVNEDGYNLIARNHNNLTGVIEKFDVENTLMMAFIVNPKLKNVYILHDNSESGLSTGELTKDTIERFDSKLKVFSLNTYSFDDILKNVQTIDKDSIILFTTYYSDLDGNSIDFEKVCYYISEKSCVPLYSLYDVGLGRGIIGGSLLSGEFQGTLAGKMGLRVLNGENADEVPLVKDNITRKVFDYNVLKKFKIDANKLNKNYEIINQPFSFFKQYKKLVIYDFTLVSFLVIFIIMQFFHTRKTKRMKNELENNNEQLTQLYEELTATDEELRQQYEEINESNGRLIDYQDKLEHTAYYDSLTELPNRLSLYEIADKDFQYFMDKDITCALVYIDMDDFKLINDISGHVLGDEFLKQFSDKLSKLIDENHLLFRIGGDEFLFYIKNIKEIVEIEKFAKEIKSASEQQLNDIKNNIKTTLSIGISLFPNNGMNIEQLLKCAEIAMYKVKSNGKNSFLFYNDKINQEIVDKVEIQHNLLNAINNNELCIYYQPQIYMGDGENVQVKGYEALVRWNKPGQGIISPLKFIKVAEESGLIVKMGEFVMKGACKFIKQLNESKNTDYSISVNVSVIQYLQSDFIDTVLGILYETKLSPNNLILEITESILMEANISIIDKLNILVEKGIKISVDDFGTGYSSLAYLKNLPIQEIKIDKLFIDDISSSSSDKCIVDSIIHIAHNLGMTVVAEGAEKIEQIMYLKEHKCDMIQGYYYSKPLPQNQAFNFYIK